MPTPRRMASCAQHDGGSRSAPRHWSRTTAFAALLSIPLETFRTWDSGRRAIPAAVLQRARDVVAHHARHTSRCRSISLPRNSTSMSGHCRLQCGRTTRGTLRGEVGLWSAHPVRHARRGRTVHGHALPPIRRTAGVSGALAGGAARLRYAAADPASSVTTHASRPGPTNWRGLKGCRLPMGIGEENAVSRSMATRRRTRQPALSQHCGVTEDHLAGDTFYRP